MHESYIRNFLNEYKNPKSHYKDTSNAKHPVLYASNVQNLGGFQCTVKDPAVHVTILTFIAELLRQLGYSVKENDGDVTVVFNNVPLSISCFVDSTRGYLYSFNLRISCSIPAETSSIIALHQTLSEDFMHPYNAIICLLSYVCKGLCNITTALSPAIIVKRDNNLLKGYVNLSMLAFCSDAG